MCRTRIVRSRLLPLSGPYTRIAQCRAYAASAELGLTRGARPNARAGRGRIPPRGAAAARRARARLAGARGRRAPVLLHLLGLDRKLARRDPGGRPAGAAARPRTGRDSGAGVGRQGSHTAPLPADPLARPLSKRNRRPAI